MKLNMIYYIYINGEQKGPVTLEELTKYSLLRTTKVWREDQIVWKDASDFDELKDFLPKTPPPLIITPPLIAEEIIKNNPPVVDWEGKEQANEIKFEKSNMITTIGIISAIIGIPLLFVSGIGVIPILYGIMQLSHPRYPIIFRSDYLLSKTTSINSTKKIGYNEIKTIEYHEKKIIIYHKQKKISISRIMFRQEDWNLIVNQLKSIQ